QVILTPVVYFRIKPFVIGKKQRILCTHINPGLSDKFDHRRKGVTQGNILHPDKASVFYKIIGFTVRVGKVTITIYDWPGGIGVLWCPGVGENIGNLIDLLYSISHFGLLKISYLIALHSPYKNI